MTIFDKKERTSPTFVDPKWLCPEDISPFGTPDETDTNNPYYYLKDPSHTPEEKQRFYESFDWSPFFTDEESPDVEYTEYEAPGCPEEPDTPVKILVYRPKNLKKKKSPAVLHLVGGGMMTVLPKMFPITRDCLTYNCPIVVPYYRPWFVSRYPGAVNDCHAAYQWMVDNAEMLGIDPDKIVITGLSTGAQLALSIPFRLMEYGYNPRGIVAEVPIVDDRNMCRNYHDLYFPWLGEMFADPLLKPDAFANRATQEECIGYPPVFIHTRDLDLDIDNVMVFAEKVRKAKSFVELHEWGGMEHARLGIDTPLTQRVQAVIDANVQELFDYDLRRPWVYEDEK